MKKQSKVLSVVLALTLVIGSFAFAFADDTAAGAQSNTATQTAGTQTTADQTTTGGAAGTTTPAAKSDKIVVLYTNDVHCGIDQNIGYAGLAAYKADKLAETDYVTLVDVGDSIQGEAIGTLSKGSYIVDIMNEVGYDYAVPGNHEFDYGMTTFLDLTKKAEYDYLCCNFIDLRTNSKASVFEPYAVETYGDTKVAFVGIDTPESFVKSTPTYFQDEKGNYIYDFCNDSTGKALYEQVQKTVDAAIARGGADYVIAVGHLGVDEQSAPWRSTDVIANTEGIDAFIDGHSHSTIPSEKVKNMKGEEVLLTSTGTKLAAIGELTIDDGKITTGLVTDYAKKDAETESFINGIKSGYENMLNQVVAKTSVELTINGADGKRAVRNAETNLGDLCADAYRAMLGADVAFVNGGGVRDNIAAGDITYGDIIAVHPFGNMACLVEATGQEIADALEMAARTAPDENGGFLQVSGLTYTIDPSVASTVKVDDKSMFVSVDGARRVKDIKISGAAIDLSKTYTVASHNYMLKSGGDGINMFMDNKILRDEVMIDNQVLINYIVDGLDGVVGAEYSKPQGRIVYATGDTALPFTDLKGYNWAKDAITYVYENELFKGTTATTFSPADKATRGMVVTVLDRATSHAAITATESAFCDVKMSAYYGPSVEWASANEIVKGMGLRTNPATGTEAPYFAPNTPMTRQDIATVILNYATYMEKGPVGAWMIHVDYTDTEKISEYALEGVAFCKINGIMGGYTDGSFNPKATVTRAELASIMKNLSEFMAK